MGVESCFCCFRNKNPVCLSSVGLAANIITFGFILWGILDLNFIKKGSEAIYIISFVLLCLCLLFYFIIFIIIIIRRCRSSRSANSFGRILCLLILGLSVLSLIFLIIGFIIELVEHVKLEKDFPVKLFSTREWAALIVPLIIGIIGFIIMALCANALFRQFSDLINSSPFIVNVAQNSINTIPSAQQPGILSNNSGVFPNIQESGTNIKN